ncbi:MAG: hypothetical protein U0W24_11315 [Bacteroidales bacterium]
MNRLLFLILIVMETAISAQTDTSAIVVPGDSSSFYVIKLKDNTILSGKIIEKKPGEIIFEDITVGRIVIPMDKVDKMEGLSGQQYCVITTTDGKTFSGLLVGQNDTELQLKTESLGIIKIPSGKIKEIKLAKKEQLVNGKYFFANPHPTRYFFGPSAIPLEKGGGYYQNAYLLVNGFQYGLTDHFSIGGGVVIPVLFFITPKFGYKVGKNVHLGGGFLIAASFVSDESIGFGVGYGSLTLGNNENNFTINSGFGFVKQEKYNSQTQNYDYKWEFSKAPMFSVSGALRLAPRFSLITENWIFPVKEDIPSTNDPEDYRYKYNTLLSFGFRIMGEKHSFDLAFAVPSIEGESMVIPYIGYVFKF